MGTKFASVLATLDAKFEPDSSGGTGLEPVTPSLSRRHPGSRLLTRASSFSSLWRNFTLHARAAFAFVCAPFSVLVVARGSTVGTSASEPRTATSPGDEPAHVHRGDEPRNASLTHSTELGGSDGSEQSFSSASSYWTKL